MKMNKMFAGLIAFVAGVALSAGSAFATNGYVSGDFARMKLVPHYEAGDTKATIIGIQNLSPQEASTMALHADVRDLKAYLGGTAPNATQVTNLEPLLDPDPVADTAIDMENLNTVAGVEKALADAQDKIYTEHLFIMVNVYDSMDMMMGSATLCLAEHQFGYVVLQGPMMQDWQAMDSNQTKILSVMDEEISEYGYVKVMAENRKFTGCGATAPNTLMRVDNNVDPADTLGATDGRIAAWTIIQDTGMGFFGTEVPTSTFMMESNAGVVHDDHGR